MSDELLEVSNHYRLPGANDYSKQDAELLTGRMVKCAAEVGVYGRVTGVQGFVDRDGDQKSYYGVVVAWTRKPKVELAQESILFRRDIDKHYPLVYGNELVQAERVWELYEQVQDKKAAVAQARDPSQGRGQ